MTIQHDSAPSGVKGVSNVPPTFQTFVGVDLHKCTVSLAAVNTTGELTDRLTISTKCMDRIEAWLKALPRPVHLVVETNGFIEWFIDRFRSCVGKIDIGDARRLALLRGTRRKNDRNDSLDFAKRLARGECPLGWIADEQTMRLRKLGRHWRRLSRTLSRAKHGMKSILNAANLRGPKFDGASAQRWLLAHGQKLKAEDRMAFADMLDVVQLMERQRAVLRMKIIELNGHEQFAAATAILQSVPGIATVWSCIIAAEIGDFKRFPNADTLEFWAGITPDNQESAGRTVSGHISKAGSPTLRWALCNAALCLCRSDGRQEKIRQRLIRRVGKPRANVAMGRRLLRILYAMMRDGAQYKIGQRTIHTARANNARLNGKRRKAA